MLDVFQDMEYSVKELIHIKIFITKIFYILSLSSP